MQSNRLKILFIEDVSSDVDLAVLELRKEKLDFDYKVVCTPEETKNAIEKFCPDIVISDYSMPAYNGLEALRDVKKLNKLIPFILYTGSINEETAVECIKSGAADYIIKEHMTRLPFAVKEVLEKTRIANAKKDSDILLKESQLLFETLTQVSPVGIFRTCPDGYTTYVNPKWMTLSGLSFDEAIGFGWMKAVHPDDVERVKSRWKADVDSQRTSISEYRFLRADGSVCWVMGNAEPEIRENEIVGYIGSITDITKRIEIERALQESEEKFRSIAENISDIIYITDSKGIINYVSPNSIKLGYTPEECIGKHFGDFLMEGELGKAAPAIQRTIDSERLNSSILLLVSHKNGSKVFAEFSGSPFKIANENIGTLGLLRDVSDKINREVELRKLSRAVEQSPASIVITDTNGIIEYVNPRFCEVTGYSREELTGKNPRILSSREKSKEEYSQLWATILKGEDWKGEFHNRKKNGELYWESASISAIKNENDEITHFVGIKEDITEKKMMEAATIESERRYRELFLNNPVPTYIFDVNTYEFIDVNDATVEFYGYSRDEFASMTLKDIRPPEEIPDLIETVKNLGTGKFHSAKMIHRKKNGDVFPVEIVSHGLPEKNGRITRLVMATDISERVIAADHMKIAREKAEASDKLKTTFLNNISHEVRTPLNGILGFAEIISQPDLSEEEKKESVAMLFESSDRLLNTITNYMDISLITSGNLTPNIHNFHPSETLKDLFREYEKLCCQKNLELILEVGEGKEKISVNSDQELFRKIISHLLNNAVKFTDKGMISYGFTRDSDELLFYVKDTGIGIADDAIDKIFNRFSKEDRVSGGMTEGSGSRTFYRERVSRNIKGPHLG